MLVNVLLHAAERFLRFAPPQILNPSPLLIMQFAIIPLMLLSLLPATADKSTFVGVWLQKADSKVVQQISIAESGVVSHEMRIKLPDGLTEPSTSPLSGNGTWKLLPDGKLEVTFTYVNGDEERSQVFVLQENGTLKGEVSGDVFEKIYRPES